MGNNSESIVGFTQAEIAERQAKGEMRSDWKKAAAQPIPDGTDPDDAMEQSDWATAALPMPRVKSMSRCDSIESTLFVKL